MPRLQRARHTNQRRRMSQRLHCPSLVHTTMSNSYSGLVSSQILPWLLAQAHKGRVVIPPFGGWTRGGEFAS